MTTYQDRRTGQTREVPAESLEWHARDPEGFASWQAYADAINEAGAAMDKVWRTRYERNEHN